MAWKNWPYWLRGSIIFLIFPIIGLYGFTTCRDMDCIIWLPFAGAAIFIEGTETLFHAINFIFYLVLGAIIGWIYGKIKSK